MSAGEGLSPPSREPANSKPPGSIGFTAAVREVYAHLSKARRRQFFGLLTLMMIGGIADLGTIGSILPFLSLLADPSGPAAFPWATRIFDAMNADSAGERLIAATILFSAFAIFAGIARLQLSRSTQDFAFQLGHDLVVEVQRRLLLQPYGFHIQRHTSTLLSAIEKTEILVFEVLLPLMQAAISGFLAAVIVAALLYIDPTIALIAAATFSIVYLLASRIARRRLEMNSVVIATGFEERLKIAQEGFGGIRDVIIDNSQSVYLRLFEAENARLSRARANTAFIGSAPRFLIETVGMVIIAVIALATAQREGGLGAALPVLGAVALGAQRLLPLVQQIYNGWSTASGYLPVLGQILDLLKLPAEEKHSWSKRSKPLPFGDRITIDTVSFGYPARRGRAVDEVSLEIPCGSTLALIGETGSGKSTLADLVMGLLEPTGGEIRIDGVALTGKTRRRWRRSIAHVPQSIFLADASIAANIALGVPDETLDSHRVEEAARKAQLHEFIVSLPDSYATQVGERGIRLSGGQRQRLGIARAIYKQAPVLVLDEATNALDGPMEAKVIDALHRLGAEGRTIIIIAHRASTIARCDIVARLHKGRLVELGSSSGMPGSSVRTTGLRGS